MNLSEQKSHWIVGFDGILRPPEEHYVFSEISEDPAGAEMAINNMADRIEALEKQVAEARAQGRVDGLREAAGFVMSGWGGEVGEAIASDIDALARTEFEPAGHSSGHDDAGAARREAGVAQRMEAENSVTGLNLPSPS